MLKTIHVIVVPYRMAESISEIYMTVSIIFKQLCGKDVSEEDIAKIKKET